MTTHILCFGASLRRASMNKKLARSAAVCAELAGARASTIDLANFRMPIYDGDLEEADGVPETAAALAREIMAAQGLIIASPEYNGGPPAVLKNCLDWITRLGRAEGEPRGKDVLNSKPTLLVSCSPGGLGGLRGTIVSRAMLAHLGLWLMPMTVAVGNGGKAFNPDGQLADEGQQGQLDAAIKQLVKAAGSAA